MLNNPKYGDVNTLEELINNWDMLEIPDALFDVVGYIIYLEEKVHAGKLKFCCSWQSSIEFPKSLKSVPNNPIF